MNTLPRTTTLLRPLFSPLEPLLPYFHVNELLNKDHTYLKTTFFPRTFRPILMNPWTRATSHFRPPFSPEPSLLYFRVNELLNKDHTYLTTIFFLQNFPLNISTSVNSRPRTTSLLRPLFFFLSRIFPFIFSVNQNLTREHVLWRPLFLWNFPLKKFSPDVILCGWLGLKHQVTN